MAGSGRVGASENKQLHLNVALFGKNPVSHSCVSSKTRAAADVGINNE